MSWVGRYQRTGLVGRQPARQGSRSRYKRQLPTLADGPSGRLTITRKAANLAIGARIPDAGQVPEAHSGRRTAGGWRSGAEG